MNIDWVRAFCLALPHSTEQVQWEDSLVFKVGGKMYAVASLEPGPHWLSLKCSDEEYFELIESPGIVPAPYLARAHWVALESDSAVARAEVERLLKRSHALIFEKLSKKTRLVLAQRKRSRRKGKAKKRRPRNGKR